MHKLSFRAVAIETNSHHIIKNSLWFRIKSQTYRQMFFISQTSLSTSLPLSNRNEVTWIYLKVFERQEKTQPNAYLPQLSKMLLLNQITWIIWLEIISLRVLMNACVVFCALRERLPTPTTRTSSRGWEKLPRGSVWPPMPQLKMPLRKNWSTGWR